MDKKLNQLIPLIPEEALKRIRACESDPSMISLDLSVLGLTYIPSEIRTIEHLRELDLSGNQISQIEGLPESLTDLDLRNNQISQIEGLPEGLRGLYLSGNQISQIEGLPESLRVLNLSNNEISQIEGLPESLTKLYLVGNQISQIEGLPESLTELDLVGNQISQIEGLPEGLRGLYLSGNQISQIEGLPESLTVLYLSYNEISQIDGLPESLTHLDLNNNQIEDYNDLLALIPFLESNKFSRFDISNNPFLEKEPFTSDLYESGWDVNHTERLLSDLNFILSQSTRKKNSVNSILLPTKLLLLGNSDAGKSTLSQYLINDQFANEKIQSTDVLEVSIWYYQGEEGQPYGLIYDFGGQDYFHGTYQLFFTEESVYAVLWDRQSNKNSKQEPTEKRPFPYYNYALGYWLGNIRYLTKDLPELRRLEGIAKGDYEGGEKTEDAKVPASQAVTLIENKIDLEENIQTQPVVPIEYPAIKDHYRISLQKSPQNVSAYRERRKLVKEHLKSELSKISGSQSFRTDHAQLINAFLTKKDEGEEQPYKIDRSRFLNYCFGDRLPDMWQHKDADMEVIAVLRLLHNRGLLLYYHDDPSISDIVFLHPSKVLQEIKSKIFKKGREQNGKLGAADVKILDTQDLQLAISQSIIFHNQYTGTPKLDKYIIPALLEDAPEQDGLLYKFAISNMKISFALRFKEFMPYGLMNRLICAYGNNPHEKHFYQNEIIFKLDSHIKVWITCVPEDLCIKVYLDSFDGNKIIDVSVMKYLYHTLMACYYRIPVIDFTSYRIFYDRNKSILRDKRSIAYNKQLSSEYKDIMDIWNGPIKVSLEKAESIQVIEELKKFEFNFYSSPFVRAPIDLMISLDDKYYISHADLDEAYENQVKEVKGIPKKDIAKTNKNGAVKFKMLDRYRFRAFSSGEDNPPKRVFISYAHADIGYKEELMKYLIGMRREKMIEVWEDGRLTPGDQWDDEIRSQLEQAEWVIMLISQQFVNSSYIYETELKMALENMEQRRARIIPIIIEDCDWSSLPLSFSEIRTAIENQISSDDNGSKSLSSIEAMPKNEKSRLVPINEWPLPNKAWMEVVRQLRGMVKGSS